ncbi:helix-turn-helix domain-containing protein [Clostridium beijerinckii]|uniref:helix-turn-helix domain-containing protein n=1 Tax=Clostridium beijerinckii TaxID=1520 RepID=UPI00098CDAA2|nr:helix-turn-helix transcriptional regulator [Clostridium beijerinckii]OOM63028.1 DNA-binding transcriptional repressor PuuR [Clostridium beijerinckii]OOM64568.1 DNA-binding transcriptional repressor PuuR [Clostridium beijerinckii]CUU47023.1 putative transcriptional regulator [Clostridium beijerinckii]
MKPHEKLKLLRLNRNLTTYDVSELTGIPQSTISKMENGKRKIETDSLELLAKAFNVSVNEFFESDISDSEDISKTNKLDEYIEKNKIFFSKFEKLTEKDKNKIIKMIEMFEEETES